jgi:hypothetical protein
MGIGTKYKRAFDWRLSSSDRVPAEAVEFAIRTLSRPEHLEFLEDLLSISRRRKNNNVVLGRLQMWLLNEISGDERTVKGLKARAEERGLNLYAEAPKDLDSESVRLKKAVENGVHFHRARANCIRQIGDGIAWRAFGFDRAAMRLLSERATKQHVTADGTTHELEAWAKPFDDGDGISLLNSVTNVLGIGDVTVAKKDGSGEILEVKASKTTSGRLTRQKQKMREVVKLLSLGQGTVEDREVTIQILEIVPENDLQALLQLLDRASRDGWSAGRISDCCYIECLNTIALKNSKEAPANLERLRTTAAGTFLKTGDQVSEMTSLDFLAFTPNCMPFSVFPFPPKACVELMAGAAAFRSYFNISAFFRELDRNGWRFNRSAETIVADSKGFATVADTVGEVEKDGFRVSIPPGYITRMAMELLRPSVIVRELDELHRQGQRARPEWDRVVYSGEPSVWE